MEQVYGPELSPAAGAVANIPQKSIRKNACRRVYAPATKLRSRKAALKLAHATGSLKFYGTLTAPSLLARKTLTFADFLREPEIREWILAQEDSDATAMMDEILAEGSCCHTLDDTCAYLKLLCRRRAAERLQPIRYWQRVKNSLLYPYLGVHAALDWNRKAEKGEVARLDRHGAYRSRERDRLAARRSVEGRAQELKQRIARLRRQAKDFDLKAQGSAAKAALILAAAKAFEDQAKQKRVSAAELSDTFKKLKGPNPVRQPREGCRTN